MTTPKQRPSTINRDRIPGIRRRSSDIGPLPSLVAHKNVNLLVQTQTEASNVGSKTGSHDSYLREAPSPISLIRNSEVLGPKSLAGQAAMDMKNENFLGPASMVYDWLFLGSRANAANERHLRRNRIRHIVNVTETCPNYYEGDGIITYHRYPLFDEPDEDISVHFAEMCELLERCRVRCEPVLVHCTLGVSRSSTVVLAYLLKYGEQQQPGKPCPSPVFPPIQQPDDNNSININSNSTQLRLTTPRPLALAAPITSTPSTPPRVVRTIPRNSPSNAAQTRLIAVTKRRGPPFSLVEAFWFLRGKRDVVCPNIGFCRQLERWEVACHGKSTMQQLPMFYKASAICAVQ